ncbi:MAG: type II toxin-antitoxin system RatA family toxin [Pseudomonadota bacterium]
MRSVDIRFIIRKHAQHVYDLVADFPSYEAFADAVRKIDIYNASDRKCESCWEVKFRDGILRWHEHDEFFPENRIIRFVQTKGDLAVFEGHWKADEIGPEETELSFQATLDLGLPQLEKLLEPIAEQALRENIVSIVSGLFPGFSNLVQTKIVDEANRADRAIAAG